MKLIGNSLDKSAKNLLMRRVVLLITTISSITAWANNVLATRWPANSQVTVSEERQQEEERTSDCFQLTSHVYQVVLDKLNSKKYASFDTLKADVESALEGVPRQPEDLILLPLDNRPPSTLLVKFHCFLTVSRAYSSFRILKSVNGQYTIAASSAHDSLLSQTDETGLSVDRSIVAITLPPSSETNRQYILTEWVRAGMSPAPFSLIVWEWDGKTLRPIWHRLNLVYATAQVLGRVIILALGASNQDVLPDGTPKPVEWRREAYRLSDKAVVFDGLLTQALLERYLREQIITPKDADSFLKLAQLWGDLGAVNKAIPLYEQALKLDSNQRFRFLHLVLAELYEQQGQYREAIAILERYRNLVDEKLTAEGRQKIDSQIEGLREKARRKLKTGKTRDQPFKGELT